MVERPIKKSERAQNSEDGAEQSENYSGKRRGKGKGKRGGRGRDERDRKPPVSPALMRGPKPQPSKPIEEEAPETVATEEGTMENSVDETGAEADTDVTAEQATTEASIEES